MEPCITVVITTYQRPWPILERALKSVLNQTLSELEIFVVNDCPENKELAELIENEINKFHDDRIHYLLPEHNCGASGARNIGILASTCDYIAFLDDDDEWLPDKIEKQLKVFSEDVGMVYSPFYNIIDGRKPELTIRSTKSGDIYEDMLWRNRMGGASMSIIRRDILIQCGLFDTNLPAIEDYDMWLRITKMTKVKYINEPFTKRYLQEVSLTGNMERQKIAHYLFMQKHNEEYLQHPKAMNYRINKWVNCLCKHGYFAEAKVNTRRAVQVQPFTIRNITEPFKGMIKYLGLKLGLKIVY